MYVCGSECGYASVSHGAHGSHRISCPRVGLTGGCEQYNLGAENWTQVVSGRAISALSCRVIFPASRDSLKRKPYNPPGGLYFLKSFARVSFSFRTIFKHHCCPIQHWCCRLNFCLHAQHESLGPSVSHRAKALLKWFVYSVIWWSGMFCNSFELLQKLG